MKKILFFVIAILSLIVSCSEEDTNFGNDTSQQEFLIKTVKIPFDKDSGKVVTEPNLKIKSEPTEKEYFYSEITMYFRPNEKLMPSFKSTEEANDFITNFPGKVYGEFDVFIDNELVASTTINKGIQTSSRMYLGQVSPNPSDTDAYPCTFKGIKKCAIDRIHALNWYDRFLCICAGIGCVQNMYISCTIDNCGLK